MTIQELEDKHHHFIWKLLKEEVDTSKEHSKLSIQFAIDVLEEINSTEVDGCGCGEGEIFHQKLENKIQELKQYLNE